MKTVVDFEFEKATKNTWRFKEMTDMDATPVVGVLYLQKDTMKDGQAPNGLRVTIETV